MLFEFFPLTERSQKVHLEEREESLSNSDTYNSFRIYEYYVNCGHTNEMKMSDHGSCDYDLSNRKLSPKNVFGASTGFEPVASVLALQCSTN